MRPSPDYSAQKLLEAAREVLVQADAVASGVWPRAAAHLCRQALESGLVEFWSRRLPGMQDLPLRVQLLCLPTYFNETELSHTISYTWTALSNACHHHVYELAPTFSEIDAWIKTVEAMLEGFRRQ